MRSIGRPLLPVLAMALLAGCVSGAPGRERSPRALPARHVLPNGVPVIVEEHRGSEVVALQLWVRAGGRDEAADELGLAHYLEHMLFKGTATRPAGFVEREIEGVGGRMNAGTSLDYTFYHAILPARHAVEGIRLLADVAVNASLEERLLEAEKHVVLEEMRLNEDDPRRFLARQLYVSTFPGHPYGRPVIGTAELVRGLRRDTLLAFYRRHYVPGAFALVVVGAIEPETVLRVAATTLGAIPRAGYRRTSAPAPPPSAPVRIAIARPGAVGHLGLAWQGPRLDHPDTPAVDLLAWVLGQSRTSRLVESLRERQGLVTSIVSRFSALEGAGLVTVTAQLDGEKMAEAEQAVLAEIARLREHGITEAELRRAVTAAEAEHEFGRETAEGRARRYGHAETVWRLEEEHAYLDRLRAVTRADIQMVARRYLDAERYVRVALTPS